VKEQSRTGKVATSAFFHVQRKGSTFDEDRYRVTSSCVCVILQNQTHANASRSLISLSERGGSRAHCCITEHGGALCDESWIRLSLFSAPNNAFSGLC